jgi:MYXO-CTERM domain-containing protein
MLSRRMILAACPAVACLALLSARPAGAQPVRPNILIVFDTSTSMLAVNADGSPLCDNRGQNSRIYRLKQAIRDTLTEIGTDEANFGLARFPQRTTPETNRGCFRGHYINSVESGTTAGCKTSAANETSDGNWFTPTIAEEVVVVPVTRGLPPTSAADYDPLGGNVQQLHLWLNNREVSDGRTMTDPEIRSGGAKTPLAASLFYSRLYFQRYVKPLDPRARCRKDIVILVTDGQETCGGDAPGAAEQLFRAGVEVYVVVQVGEEGTVHNQIADRGSGGKRKQSIRVDFTNPEATKAALVGIIAESVPPGEICNGEDDNCNDLIDEEPLPGVGAPCLCPGLTEAMVGKGICRAGKTVCKGKDGIVCEGCVGPQPEICNGLDDNCNGEIDEGVPEVGQACTCNLAVPLATLMVGECKPGTKVCRRGQYECEGCQNPTFEICDCKDNNCNGQVDEGNPCAPGFTCLRRGDTCRCELLCSSDEIPCPKGYQCDRTQMPPICVSTKCTGKVCPAGFSCDEGDGQCKDKCLNVRCEAPKRCINGLCADCYATGCPEGQVCRAGVCEPNPCYRKTCGDGEYCDEDGRCVKTNCHPPCRQGEKCVRGRCAEDPCANKSCSEGEFCDPSTAQCKVDICRLKTCPGQACVRSTGECADSPCATVRCPTCYRCELSNDGAGQCVVIKECLPETTIIHSAGGGCSCRVGDRGGMPLAALLAGLGLALVFVLRRRRAGGR